MFLNVIQIAESFGVSESVVEGWVRNEGLPCTLDRGRLIFDRAQAAQWAAAHGLAAQAGFLAPEASVFATGCQIEPLLKAGRIWRNVAASEVPATIDKIVAALPATQPSVRQLLSQRLRAKDGITWAPIGHGFALPHPSARIALGRDSGTLALLFLREEFFAPDDSAGIKWMFFFIAPSPRAHLDLLGRLSHMLVAGGLRELVIKGASDEEIFSELAAMNSTGAKP
jgi:PTS system nitrogen regulatory IIA component